MPIWADSVAYEAMHSTLDAEGDPGEIDGFSQDQRFFIAAARSGTKWPATTFSKRKSQPIRIRRRRSAPPNRSAMDPFFEAFDITAGDEMYLAPEDRVVIW